MNTTLKLVKSEGKRTDILKVIAVLSMSIDHIGMFIFPQQLIFRVIGRIAFPVFAYQLVSGYRNTSSLHNYITRLTTFAIISQLPYIYFTYGLNILFTLILGIAAIYLFDKNYKWALLLLLIMVHLYSTFVITIDYSLYGVLIPLIFHIFYNEPNKASLGFIVVTLLFSIINNSILQVFSIVSLPLIFNNWKVEVRVSKYLFYIFYPLHITVLVLIRYYM